MTPATEKAAPIPADVLATARNSVADQAAKEGAPGALVQRIRDGGKDDWLVPTAVAAILADRASQEERHTPECIANIGEREKRMVVIERGEAGKPTVWCDPCIAPLVKALNDAGICTVASCCGHSHRPGSIALADGRWLVIGRDEVEWRRIEALFPVDINGEDRSQEERIREDERDRLYASLSETRGLMQRNEPSAWTMATRFWLEQQGAMLPADRVRLRGGAS